MNGNDIVDLQCAAIHPRFFERITSEEEKFFLTPNQLWQIWAAKEAAYKLLKKTSSHVRFIPKHFVCSPTLSHCRYEGTVVHIAHLNTADYVHAAAFTDPSLRPIVKIGKIRSATESEEVRAMAIELIDMLGYSDVWIAGRPPCVYKQGKIIEELDISLSHDGRFAAVALTVHSADDHPLKQPRT